MAVLTPPFGMKHSCRSVAPEKKMDERPVRELQFHICYNLAIYDAQKLAFTKFWTESSNFHTNPVEIISTTKLFRQTTVTLLDSDFHFLLYLDNEV